MLDEFVTSQRDELIQRAQARVVSRARPGAVIERLANGVPVFLDQLGDALRLARQSVTIDHDAIQKSARQHGGDLLRMGYSISEVVHDYGDICQVITERALDLREPLTGEEFRTLNLCLDDAIAGAVAEYAHLRESAVLAEGTERLGVLAHEMRNTLNTATLAYNQIKDGRVGPGGATAGLLGRSLMGLAVLIDRSLADVRLDAGLTRVEKITVCDLVDEIEIAAALLAHTRTLSLRVSTVPRVVSIDGDRTILAAALMNLLQNAFKFTRKAGTVSLTTHATDDRVLFEVADQCGGLPPGKAETMFLPYTQMGRDHSGIGLGLSICLKAAHANRGDLRVRDLPGTGCVFTLDLPRGPPPPRT